MEEILLNVQEVAYKVGCSIQTIGSYYRFKRENPDNIYALMLPDYVRRGKKNTRYWKESDVEAIIRFRNSIPQGRNGALGSVTQKYVKGTSKKIDTESQASIEESCNELFEKPYQNDGEMQIFVDYAQFGKWVRETRLEEGMAQKELANRLDCTIEHLSKVENGHRIPSRLMAENLLTILGYEFVLAIKKKN